MATAPRIAIDAMGGDIGPAVMVAGAALAHKERSDLSFSLFGDEQAIRRELDRFPGFAGACEIVHTPDVIAAEDKPSQAIRRAKTTSMGRCIAAVKEGSADAAVSGGNTGALMAMAKLALRTMPASTAPPRALLPSRRERPRQCSISAQHECDTRNLVQFEVWLGLFAHRARRLRRASICSLAPMSEGHGRSRKPPRSSRGGHLHALRRLHRRRTISRGDFDVVVTDGFSGNIALKSLEGTARFVGDLLRRAFASSLRSKLGYLISRSAARLLRDHLDPNNHNGAVFLGLNGLVVKSHGSANEKGVANAIGVAARMVRADITRKIAEDLDNISARRAAAAK